MKFFFSLFQPEKLNVYKNDSDISWDYTLGEYRVALVFSLLFCYKTLSSLAVLLDFPIFFSLIFFLSCVSTSASQCSSHFFVVDEWEERNVID